MSEVAVCRSLSGPTWLLAQKVNGHWRMISEHQPLSAVISDAVKDLGGRDFSFSSQRMDPHFTFELGRPNSVQSIMAPESRLPDALWGVVVIDRRQGKPVYSRGEQRFRGHLLRSEAIDAWFRDPRCGGTYQSFVQANGVPWSRDLLVRHGLRLCDLAPWLYEGVAA
jgi:hypothetical protein